MNQSDDNTSQIDPLIYDMLNRPKYRSRHSYYKYRLSLRQICLLITSCCCSFVIFTITFYLNSTTLRGYFAHLFLSPPPSKFGSAIAAGSSDSAIRRKNHLSIYDQKIKYDDFNYMRSKTLTYEKGVYENNIEVLYRLPGKTEITGLLLIFHGCSRSANDWFHTIERQRIIGAAIDLGYGCLAFQSTDKHSRCWSNNVDIDENDDVQMVLKGLEGFYKEYPKLESLPRFTFGASSGGIFSSIFVINPRYKIQGQIIFIAFVLPEILETYVKTKSYPATAWIYMLRDTEFASEERINNSKKIFAEQKIPHISFAIEPICLVATTFHDRIHTITRETSRYMFYRFQQNQWLDSQNCLIYNPRRKDTWKLFLYTPTSNSTETIRFMKNLDAHKDILPDFLNTIYGEHEISFERSFEALEWHRAIYDDQKTTII